MKSKYPGISRIDSSNTHGWYVRIYANGGVFTSKLFSDSLYGSKEKALKDAIKFRDHNQMVANLQKDSSPAKRKMPFYKKAPKNNTSGVVGVNEVLTAVNGRQVHYYQSTWSEDGKTHSKKFYITENRSKDEAFTMAVAHRKSKEDKLYQDWLRYQEEQKNK